MLITTHNLTKKYGEYTAVDNLNIDIPQGALVAYLGTNGTGKSTTMKMLTGLLEPTSGLISRTNNLKIGIVFQASVLDSDLTVEENLISRAKMYKNVDHAWITELIKLIGLTKYTKQRYGTLSGGQKRRVDIARALLNHPDLLFLDEPTTGLDIQTRNVIWSLLRKLQKEQNLTVFLTTHYLEEASEADMIYVLENGHLLAQGSSDELRKQFAQTELTLTFSQPIRLDCGKQITNNQYLFNDVDTPQAIELIEHYKDQLLTFEYHEGTLDDAFIAITGKELQ